MARTSARHLLRSGMLTDLELTTGPRLVLLALADHANTDGISYPSQETLALETGMQRSGVRKALTVLHDRAIVEVVEKGGPRKSARYRITFDR